MNFSPESGPDAPSRTNFAGPEHPEGAADPAPPFWNPAKIALAILIAVLLGFLAPDFPPSVPLFGSGAALAFLFTSTYARREHRLGSRVSEPLQLLLIAILTPAIPTIIVAATLASAFIILETTQTLITLFKAGAAP